MSDLVGKLESLGRGEAGPVNETCAKAATAIREYRKSTGAHREEIESLRSQLDKANQALRSVAGQCGNVIFNCEQRPAHNERHLSSWRSVKSFAEAALTDDQGTSK